MSLAGNLKTFPLTDLLQWFSISRKTGVLVVTAGSVTFKLHIHKGVLVTVVTNDPFRRTGQFLLSRGYIDEEKLRAALNHQEENGGGDMLGQILQRKGHVTEADLKKALRERLEEIVYDLFLTEDGTFHFDMAQTLPEGTIPMDLNLDFLVLEGIRRKDEWERIRELLPGDEVRLRRRKDASPSPKRFEEFELLVFDRLESEHSVGELIMQTRRSPYDVYSALYHLITEDCLEITETQSRPPAPPPVRSLADMEDEIRRLASARDFKRSREKLNELRSQLLDHALFEKLNSWLELEECMYLRNTFPPHAVPALSADLRRIRKEDLSPKEGFLLSRLGEGMDVKTLCQVMPMGETEILRFLSSLEKKSVIQVKQ